MNLSSLSFVFFLIYFDIRNSKGTILEQMNDDHPFIEETLGAVLPEQKKEKFMLIPSLGFEMKNQPNHFTLFVNGWLYEPLASGFFPDLIQRGFSQVLNFVDQNEKFTDEQKQERLGPFFVRDVEGHYVKLQLSSTLERTVSTDRNGRFVEKIIVSSLNEMSINGNILKYTAMDNDHHQTIFEGTIYLMRNSKSIGCSIISDIDDTIKISEVPNKKKLMINTFKKEFQAVPGMSQVYHHWQSTHHCLIHYVSAMPSQLYHVTQKFLDRERFPPGSFHMRHLKLVGSDKRALMTKIAEFIQKQASEQHKLAVIEDILSHASDQQRFVLVGDSGELDPEIYGEIARRHPRRIQLIFIRRVDGGPNDVKRFETAFRDVSKEKWHLFSDANELPQQLYDESSLNEDNSTSSNSSPSSSSHSLINIVTSISFILFFTMKFF